MFLPPKPPPHVRDDDPHQMLVGVEQLHELVADPVRRLRRDPHRHLVRPRLMARDQSPRLDGMRAAAMLLEGDGEHAGSGGERGVAVAVLGPDFLHHIVARLAVRGGGAGGERVPAVGDGGQGLVLDDHHGCRVFGRVARVGDDDRDRLAGVADLVLGQHHRLCALREVPGAVIGGDDQGRERRLQIVMGEDRTHAVMDECGGGVDGHDAGVGMRTPHEGGLQQPGHVEIVDVAALAGE